MWNRDSPPPAFYKLGRLLNLQPVDPHIEWGSMPASNRSLVRTSSANEVRQAGTSGAYLTTLMPSM